MGALLAALLPALATIAFAAPAAMAAYSVSNVSATPTDGRAGANSDLPLSFDLAGGQLKDLVIHLPPGLVGNPLATSTCREDQLKSDACPAKSQVGTIANDVTIGGLPQTANGKIYNVEPRQGEPARFGFVLNAPPADKIVLQSPATLRASDFGLDTTLNNVPNTATVFGVPAPITITGVSLTLQGKVGTPPQGFLRNPTSCGSHAVTVDATAYSGETASAGTTFSTIDCTALPFSPQFSAQITEFDPSKPIEVSTSIKQTIQEAGLKRATVTLPSDLGPNGVAFNNTCAEADFQTGNCPEASIVGDARAESPLQAQALTGPVVLIGTPVGNLPLLGLDLRGALALKLKGEIGLDATNPAALRTTVTFDDLPDIPISDFSLTFAGGAGGLNLAARSPCEPPPFQFNTSFLSHAGVTVDGSTKAESNCKGTGGKKPKAKVKLSAPKSGDPVLKLALNAGATRIRSAEVALPKPLSFASGRKFAAGSSVKADGKRLKGGAVKASKRVLKLKAKSKGFAKAKGRFADGAVVVPGRGEVKGRFKVVIRDVDGKRTTLGVRAK